MKNDDRGTGVCVCVTGLHWVYNFDKQTLDLHLSILFLTPPMLQTSDLERYDQNCHFKSDNYFLIRRMPMPEN